MPQNEPNKPTPNAAPWYSIRAKGDATAEVLIYGDIGDSWFGESVTAQQFVKDLQEIKDKSLTVRINSFGGSVADGVAIYNAIKRHPMQKDVEIDGVAMSIASLIAMAGDTVRMADNAMFMIHAPWGGMYGNAPALREYADVLDKYAEAMATSYSAKSGMSREDALQLVTDGVDHYYSAQEAKDAGFVDEVTTAAPDDEAARYMQAAFARFQVPAAAAARFAAVAAQFTPKKEIAMPEVTAAPAASAQPDNVVEIEKAAKAREQARIKARNEEIRAAAKPFMAHEGMTDYVNALLDDPAMTTEVAREKILAKLGEGAEPVAVASGTGRIELVADARDKRIQAKSSAILARVGHERADGANQYRGMSLLDMARATLVEMGVPVNSMDKMDIAAAVLSTRAPRGAQTTSDFPVILENTMHKLVLTGFNAQTSTWQRVCRIGDVSDLRPWNRIVPGILGDLDDVNEHGEYRNKAVPDGVKNAIQAKRKGNIINITPEVIINDDTSYVVSMAMGLGQLGNRAIERGFYTVYNSNPTMSDGVALYHASRGNLAGAGAVPSVTTLDTARQALMSMKAPGADQEYLDIQPGVAVVPLAQGGNTRVIVNAVYDPDTANKLQRPNMVNGMVKEVVDSPRVSGNAWTILPDPNVIPVYEVVFLDGQRAPKVSEEENFRTSGRAWKVEMPFGVGAISWYGYRNPGA